MQITQLGSGPHGKSVLVQVDARKRIPADETKIFIDKGPIIDIYPSTKEVHNYFKLSKYEIRNRIPRRIGRLIFSNPCGAEPSASGLAMLCGFPVYVLCFFLVVKF